MPVTCGRCSRKRTLQTKDRVNWTGYCRGCCTRKLIRVNDERLSTGSFIQWSERDPNNVRRAAVTCGKCGKKRFTKIPNGELRLRFTGFCEHCGHIKHPRNEKHSSGTIIHCPEWDSADKRKMAITCYNCGQKSRIWYSRINDPRWSGLCHNCTRQHENPRKRMHDEVLPSGSIIHWSERDLNNSRRVMVTCGACGHKRLVQIHPGQTGYCYKHYREVATNWISLTKQGNPAPSEKRRTGRRPGTLGFNHIRFLADVRSYIIELWDQYKSIHAITLEVVAAKFQAKGENINNKSITGRLRICAIKEPWTLYRESVLKEEGKINSF